MITTKAVCISIVIGALAVPVSAQGRRVGRQSDARRVSVQDDDGLAIRAVGFLSGDWFSARTTFNAVFDDAFGRFFGGGIELTEGPAFLDLSFSRLSKTGQRAFLYNGQVYKLNIPLTSTITPFEVSAGYRFNHRASIVPYAGVGIGSYAYSETSAFSDTGDDVSERHVGFLVVGGAEFRLSRYVSAAADAQYTRIPGILGTAGISRDAGENDLGGIAVRARVIVGVGR
jgi:opacity protein-like surface antigen